MSIQLPIVRRIRENVHGTIDISDLEDRVLSHPYVQRLRRIKQLAFLQYVFPGASHSRFEHSLGVMHLAGVAWEKLRANQKRLASSALQFDDYHERELRGGGGARGGTHGLLSPTFPMANDFFESAYTLQALRLAALLHDLGHPPFSHSGEAFLASWKTVRESAKPRPKWLDRWLDKKVDDLVAAGKDPSSQKVRHEVFTLLLLDRLFRDVYSQNPDVMWIEPQDIASIMTPEIPPVDGSPLWRFGAYRFCNELISGEFDVDRMDYLLRDSRECGVVYGIFDESRILNSLAMYFDPREQSVHLAIQFSGMAAFEDYLRARHSMYLQLYFHKTAVAAEAMIKHLSRAIPGWTLPAEPEQYARIDEHNIYGALQDAAKATLSHDPEALAGFTGTLDDLLLNRRFWKRVFEISGQVDQAAADKMTGQAESIINAAGCPVERISSANSLTRFRPRGSKDEPSRYKLRLIKKDDFQVPRVYPIEDFFTLNTSDASAVRAQITRLYVPAGKSNDGAPWPELVRARLRESLS
ncbi:HD domain-containing protein [bacterium]|nr:HD domain-containing protein [bacterium]